MASSYFRILFVFVFSLPLSIAQSNGTIRIGSSQIAGGAGNPWISASGDFAFGFKKLQENEFVLSIWFNKIAQETVVWYPKISTNGINNPVVSKGSTIQLNAQGGLVLLDRRGQPMWNTSVIDVARAVLNDSGSLVLVSSQNTSLWESFQHPTDTLLPSQVLERGDILISRKSETNFSQGRFYLEMETVGNLLAYTKSLPSNQIRDGDYYNSLTFMGGIDEDNPGVRAEFNESAIFYVLRSNNERRNVGYSLIPNVRIADYYHRVMLDVDGVLAQYYYPKASSANSRWSIVWTRPDDNICMRINGTTGSGACGYNSVCTLNGKRPVCNCPNGYSLVDPNDQYGSCQPDLSLSCYRSENGSAAADIFDFQILKDTDFAISDYEQIDPSSEEECRNACLQDCLCAAATYRSNRCWKNKLPLSNGRIDTSLNTKAFLKYRKQDVPPEPEVEGGGKVNNDQKGNNGHKTFNLLVSVLLGGSVFINLLLIGTIFLGFYLIYQKKIIKHSRGSISVDVSLRCFSFLELDEATDGFKEELGRGAFGIVYKGVIPFGSTIAVKKLDRVAEETEKEFRTEVNVIGQTHHKNLVRLIGFCDQGQNRLLVYEYMCNGTLASFLFGEHRPSWNQRIKIAQGVARGLSYLHEECSTQIIHCDIKPQNLLLDEYYNARISDFGLAKLLKLNQSKTNTVIRGTKGYVAPEWFRNNQISTKVDVFSFGVVLFEIITCRRSLNDMEVGGEENEFFVLTDYAWDCYQGGRLDELVGREMEALEDHKKLERYIMIGLWCIQENASIRPTMRTVSQMLEGIVEVTTPPCPYPSYSVNA